MSDAVKIIIDAEDRASSKLKEVADRAEKAVAKIKGSTTGAKTASEFVGQFASVLGGADVAALAGQFGQVNEKVGQFSELAKAGGAGAMAMKLGVASLVGYVSFQFGKTIGDAIFQTEKWKNELQQAKQELAELGAKSFSLNTTRLAEELAEVKLIENPSKQAAEFQKILDGAGNDAETYAKRLESVRNKIKKLSTDNTFSGALGSFARGDFNAPNTLLQGTFTSGIETKLADLREREAFLKAQKEQADATVLQVQRATNRDREEAARQLAKESQRMRMEQMDAIYYKGEEQVQQLLQQFEIERAIGREKKQVAIAQMELTDQQAKAVQWLTLQIDRAKALQSIQDQAKRQMLEIGGGIGAAVFDLQKQGLTLAEAREAAGQMVAVSLEREQELLRQQRIELEQGADALKEYLLGKQGIAKADAVSLVAEQRAIALAKEKQQLELVRKEVLQGADARKVAERQLAGFSREDSIRLTAEERMLELQRAMMAGTPGLQSSGNSRLRTRANQNDVQQELLQTAKTTEATLEVIKQTLIEQLDITSKPKPEIKLEQR